MNFQKDYAAVKQLHNQLSSELLTLPAFPEITLYQILGRFVIVNHVILLLLWQLYVLPLELLSMMSCVV